MDGKKEGGKERKRRVATGTKKKIAKRRKEKRRKRQRERRRRAQRSRQRCVDFRLLAADQVFHLPPSCTSRFRPPFRSVVPRFFHRTDEAVCREEKYKKKKTNCFPPRILNCTLLTWGREGRVSDTYFYTSFLHPSSWEARTVWWNARLLVVFWAVVQRWPGAACFTRWSIKAGITHSRVTNVALFQFRGRHRVRYKSLSVSCK